MRCGGLASTSREPEGDLGAAAQAVKEDREGRSDGRVAPGGSRGSRRTWSGTSRRCEVYDPAPCTACAASLTTTGGSCEGGAEPGKRPRSLVL